jgi:hypothetical protein
MKFGTSAYQTETPKWLWEPWTGGPAATADRYADRLTALEAFDVLLHAPEDLSTEQEHLATDLLAEGGGDLDVLLDIAAQCEDLATLRELVASVDDLDDLRVQPTGHDATTNGAEPRSEPSDPQGEPVETEVDDGL